MIKRKKKLDINLYGKTKTIKQIYKKDWLYFIKQDISLLKKKI